MLPGEIDGKRFLRAMSRFGWKVERQRGSHRKLLHVDTSKFLIVAFHKKIRRPAVKKTLTRAGIPEGEFLKKL